MGRNSKGSSAPNAQNAFENGAKVKKSKGTGSITVEPKTEGQKQFWESLANGDDLVFGLGPAGTGKTFLSIARGLQLLNSNAVNTLMIARPAVEAGEKLGFLPGDPKDKLEPYMRPSRDTIEELAGSAYLKAAENDGRIEIAPVGFMRGRTFKFCAIIVDEAQNCTFEQLKMITTRLGEGSKMIIVGDPEQLDLLESQSGLKTFVQAMELNPEGIGIHHLSASDVVRHPIVKIVLNNLETYAAQKANAAPEPSR